MDEYMFRHYVNDCKFVQETTSYVEILNYSDDFYNTCEEHALPDDEFENFLNRAGAFAPPENIRPETKLLSGLRLIVQKNTKDKDTFMPKVLSLPKDKYESMLRTMKLPRRSVETTSVVGPFFWSASNHDSEDPCLHVVHRKSDVRKKGKTRGWEMMLSHSIKTGITSGFIKGTASSDVEKAIEHAKFSAAQVGHPMLLPLILLCWDLSPANDQKQRDARDWLRRLEHAVSLRNEIEEGEQYFQDGFQIDGLNRDLVECHSHVMWKRPQAYKALCKEMEKALLTYKKMVAARKAETKARSNETNAAAAAGTTTTTTSITETERKHRVEIDRLHDDMTSRLEFYKVKLIGLENYIHTTLERLKVQREALYSLMSQREARLNLQIAGEQRRIANASKRDSTAMKTLSLLGALFLPGTYLASVFSMTFFNFQNDSSPVISVSFWIYFAITIPITSLIVVSWLWYDRRRERQHKQDDDDLEKNIDQMEKTIMTHLRKRTMSKAHTWNTITAAPRV